MDEERSWYVVSGPDDNISPEGLARLREREEAIERDVAAMIEAEAPLREELRELGFDVQTAWDFVEGKDHYTAALPVLARHLPRDYPERALHGIALALGVPEASFAWRTLVDELYRDRGYGHSNAVAVAVAEAATLETLPELIRLVEDDRLDDRRVLLFDALVRLRTEEAVAALERAVQHPIIGKAANRALIRMRRPKNWKPAYIPKASRPPD